MITSADLALRWRTLAEQFTRGDPELTASLQAIYREGFADVLWLRARASSLNVTA
jgi:hypothetical protein